MKQRFERRNQATASPETPLFSILIPCYNVKSYVKECVESVRTQTFESWEIVAVDDGSTDGTTDVLSELADALGPRMTVLRQENCGQLLSRCKAIQHARGSYVVFLDADDFLRQDALEIIAYAISGHPRALVQFRYSRCSDFGGELRPSYPGMSTLPSIVGIGTYRRWVCKNSSFNNLCGKAIPLSAAMTDEDYSEFAYVRNGEDLLQLVAVLDSIENVVLLDDALYYYRVNQESVSRTFQPDFYRSVRAATSVLRAHAEKWGDDECLKQINARWLGSVRSSVIQLSNSGYTLADLRRNLEAIGSDEMFLEAWDSVGDRTLRGKTLLGLMAKGIYLPVALGLCVIRVLKRL